MVTTEKKIGDLVSVPQLQARVGPDTETIAQYVELLAEDPDHWPFRSGTDPAPIVAYRIDGQLLVTDGHHRLQAAREAGRTTVPVTVLDGTMAQAIMAAAGANAAHGLARSPADKRRAIEMALSVPGVADMSHREVSLLVGVSQHLVASVRAGLRAARSPAVATGAEGLPAETIRQLDTYAEGYRAAAANAARLLFRQLMMLADLVATAHAMSVADADLADRLGVPVRHLRVVPRAVRRILEVVHLVEIAAASP